jgi:hypothetical protein
MIIRKVEVQIEGDEPPKTFIVYSSIFHVRNT